MGAVKVSGIEVRMEYGGLCLPMSYYGGALMLVGRVHPSVGAPGEARLRL